MEEQKRIDQHYQNKENWLKWGPYLSERQWGTVREDYSATGDAWSYFPHDHARSRHYRWGEDGIAGISDDMQQLCFALALWNGQDRILKERLFGLTGQEGNHAEDVKELYYYLENVPSHAYMKYLYKYPQRAYPYDDLVETNRALPKTPGEYELLDTGALDEGKYFDVFVEYAKADPDDIAILITVHNRGPETAPIHLLPTLWFRNEWSFGLIDERPSIELSKVKKSYQVVSTQHPNLDTYHLYFQTPEQTLFTENETNKARLFDQENDQPFKKDAFHDAVLANSFELFENKTSGTKFSPLYTAEIAPGEMFEVRLRLSKKPHKKNPLSDSFETLFFSRIAETDEFYAQFVPKGGDADTANIQRQAFAGMLWTKQFYYIDIPRWLEGDPGNMKPPASRKKGRNHKWLHLNNKDIISMPDKWEYPWYAVWDLAFHCVPLAMIDPEFAKNQLILIMREWYMAPNGQIPAYEWHFADVNPPVYAWATMKVYQMEKERYGKGDVDFLKRVFQKLMLNFTWWVNQKDSRGNNVFEGGFLGLDNIGIFDRSNKLPGGGLLEQADGTSWMANFSLSMLEMALEIALHDPTFEDVATKFFEHFIYIAESLNHFGEDWVSSWDEEEGMYYDVLHLPDDSYKRIKVRSLVGLSPMFAVSVIRKEIQDKLPDFMTRLRWFQSYRSELGRYSVMEEKENGDILLAMASKDRLQRLLHAMLDEDEFLSPHGIRSISKYHEKHPYHLHIAGGDYGVAYEPAESSNYLFGGNSNWRGPIWMPMNYILVESLYTYCGFYDGAEKVEYPTGSGQIQSLTEVADDITRRLIDIFKKDPQGRRPVNGKDTCYTEDPHFQDLILFFEYFHGDNGSGLGASHQTGWTGLVAEMIHKVAWKK